MADAEHSKCFARKGVGVQVPPPAQNSERSASSGPATDGSQVVEIVVVQNVIVEIVIVVIVVIV
jgi:hypothetical protein